MTDYNRTESLRRNAQSHATVWNRDVPVGTPVRYWPGSVDDEGVVSKTRSEAWVVCARYAVVQVEGKSGCIDLSHVKVIEQDEEVCIEAK